jgi:hypothetical protein
MNHYPSENEKTYHIVVLIITSQNRVSNLTLKTKNEIFAKETQVTH